MVKKNDIYILGLVFGGFALLIDILFVLQYIRYGYDAAELCFFLFYFIFPVIFGSIYCYNFKKIYILISYLSRIIFLIIFCIIENWFGIFDILPLVLLLIGLLIGKKKYNIFSTVILILTSGILPFILYGGLIGLILGIIKLIYDLVIWYKIGLSEFINIKKIKMLSKTIVGKEMISAEFSLEGLKASFEKGEISEEEYNRKKTEIINSL